jgi:hypothetical protein
MSPFKDISLTGRLWKLQLLLACHHEKNGADGLRHARKFQAVDNEEDLGLLDRRFAIRIPPRRLQVSHLFEG